MNLEISTAVVFESLVKGALILAAATALDRRWLAISAARRQALWSAALVAVLLLPLTRTLEPYLNLPQLEVLVNHPQTKQPEPSVVVPMKPHAASVRSIVESMSSFPDWKIVLMSVWCAGTGLLVFRRLLGSLRLAALRRTTHPLLDVRVLNLASEVFRELGIRRVVGIRVCQRGRVPLTWGTLRPTLLLPAEALKWSDARLSAAVRHEGAHIAGCDHFLRWIAAMACALHWPNPLVWFAARRMHAAQEEAADNTVLLGGTAAEEYADQLLEVAHTLAGRQWPRCDAMAMASPSTLESRILAIVDASRKRGAMSLGMFTGAATSVILVLVLATAATLHAKSEGGVSAVKVVEEKVTQDGKQRTQQNSRVKLETHFLEITGKPKGLSGVLKDQSAGTNILALSTPSAKTVESILKAVENAKEVRVLAAPKMTVFSKHKASFEAIREMPYATDWAKAANTGEWEAVSFAKKDVGIKLALTPEVNANGTINLRVVPEVTQFDGFLEEPPPTSSSRRGSPRKQALFSTQRLASEVLMNPGDSVAISGAESENSFEIRDKVPLLGDLPIIGGLFRSTIQRKSRVLILVTARILGPREITPEN